ncbi:rCG20783 [Rattus norvegicus]|uniref:RCG20783 n=1 Tax=Rattus norvegicus TaxID=10116 RepID=A6JEA4_RAT|nr:rCG20783 [Rattus norvegicus]
MYPTRKGLSQSVRTCLKFPSEDVKEQIYKLAKKSPTPSQ